MKRLWLLRHAHAAGGSPDAARPLDARGRREAQAIARAIATGEALPDRILCSPARRARETAEIVCAGLASRPELELREDLYLASARRLLASLAAEGDAPGDVLVVAHNPGLGDLALELAVEGDAAALATLERGFPTGALACYAFEIRDWRELDATLGRLAAVVLPGERKGR